MVLKKREAVKQFAKERKNKLLSSKVIHQFLWDVNEVYGFLPVVAGFVC